MKKYKVLILYQFNVHLALLNELKIQMISHGIQIDLFNSRTFEYDGPVLLKRLKFLALLVKIPKVRVVIYFLFRNKIIRRLTNHYNLVDIHFFSKIYDNLILNKSFNKIKISYWGSDIYRIKSERINSMDHLTANADELYFNTVEMKTFAMPFFKQKNKLKYQNFGISTFNVIESLKNKESTETFKTELNIPLNKLIISIGYNGKKEQQHLKIISELKKLDKPELNKLFLIFPMTYARDNYYYDLIVNALSEIDVSYQILNKSLSIDTICKYRLISDIKINMQTTDAFSASVQEYFYAKNIMILGEWLPYSWLENNGLYFIKSNFKTLHLKIKKTIQDFSNEKEKHAHNSDKIALISDWKHVSASWAENYKRLIER